MIPAFDLSLLPGDWFDLRDATSTADAGVDAATLTSELAREIPVDHRLSGVQVEAVAVRRHHKDVIFWLPAEGRWALVHLSWHEESDRNWPGTGIFEDWSDLVNEF